MGGRAKNAHKNKPIPKKTAVVAIVSRHSGKMRARKVTSVNGKTLGKVPKQHVAKTAEIFTDGAKCYPEATKGLAGHENVNHEAGEYGRGIVHTNTIESWNAILKRGINGVYHHVSEKHLDRYLDEFSFRWDHRDVSDGERTLQAGIGGPFGPESAVQAGRNAWSPSPEYAGTATVQPRFARASTTAAADIPKRPSCCGRAQRAS